MLFKRYTIYIISVMYRYISQLVSQFGEPAGTPIPQLDDSRNATPNTSWLSYFWPSSSYFSGNNQNSTSMIDQLKKILIDPLAVISILVVTIITYIYFANEFICQIFGLFLPAYYLYTLGHDSISSDKVSTVSKYFIIYSHIEFCSLLLKIFGLYFYHVKVLAYLIILYMLGYQQAWLAKIYERSILYDKIIIGLLSNGLKKVYREYLVVRTGIRKKSE